jgi:dihydropyrimidine dehydrogenase (NAD+) subunit PreT
MEQLPAARNTDGSLTHLGARIEADRCLMCADAPCAKACPADTKPDKFLRQLRFENPLGAAETVLDNNPLGGICGKVCPVSRLCEGACTRKSLDQPVKIAAVQHYLHKLGVQENLQPPPTAVRTGHRAAVIGSGPAGLSFAREMARRGSDVTVFEKRDDSGGALRYALSPVRVNHRDIDEEVSRIKAMGVKFVFNTTVSDVSKLVAEGFDAVFVSPGLQVGRSVNIKAQGSEWAPPKRRVVSALEFLESANSTEQVDAKHLVVGNNIVIIGGGSVAMDCAITARALGAKTIHIVSRESLETLPADIDEVELARKAGCLFHPECEVESAGPDNTVKIVRVSTDPVSMKVSRTNFSGYVEAGAVIMAAGQLPDEIGKRLVAGGPQLKVSDASSAGVEDGASVSHFVVAGGDIVRGGGDTVVSAVADGKRAAALALPNASVPERDRISLKTPFVGIDFESPFCLSSSPVTNSAEMIARAYDAGFAGAYYKTLNRESQFFISHPSPRLNVVHSKPYPDMAVGIQNVEQISDRPLEDNLKDINWLRKNYPTKITAASIMGYCDDDWAYLAAAAEVRRHFFLSFYTLLICWLYIIVHVGCRGALTGTQLLVSSDGPIGCRTPRGPTDRPHRALYGSSKESCDYPCHRKAYAQYHRHGACGTGGPKRGSRWRKRDQYSKINISYRPRES